MNSYIWHTNKEIPVKGRGEVLISKTIGTFKLHWVGHYNHEKNTYAISNGFWLRNNFVDKWAYIDEIENLI